ncbi:SAV_2336 N-terminal domain-related protein [Streptomyces phaeochromogenes]|uniref:SAV_2336 N-terminal domain-related protein n=1 Tax=Streptomyces phaeochromogenes TaxID=1923 RepID=UPI00224DEC51|nr:SAV_2336 N-terminal domain-related protein [Streptomyces phaeochromogenes]MCX5596991.1 SAV_2336 N-terminal domain-related protein [Streptomyces phaeochromogenes]
MPSEADAGSGTGADATTGAGTGSGTHTGAARLADVLAEAGAGPAPTSVELAELLWLAGHMKAPEAEAPATPSAHSGPGPDSDSAPLAFRGARNRAPSPHPPAPRTQPNPDHPEIPEPPNSRVPLHLPATPTPADASPADTPNTNTSHTSLLAPAPPMLPHPLKLQRALRPLKRSVPAPFGQELDEAATAHRIARLGASPQWWLPVLRPATERWLTLHLVHDTGPTMPIWRPLVRELHAALAQSGIFRTVELHRLETDGTVRRPGSQEAYADGRTVTLLISDCMGPQWRDGPAGTRWYATLRRWSARMPVAVVQPLPERLWRTTALPATTARIAAPGPAAPNSAYDVDSYAMEDLPQDVLPLPVLEASAPWLANWSALVAGAGRLPGAVGLLGTAPPPAPVDEWGRSDVERLSAEELLLRFRSLASPEAFRLAGHLAVGRAELPVMRLVHAAIERNPQPQHLAEVILSGALIAVPGKAGSYVFRPGVRELLRRTLPRTALGRTSELTARVGALIDTRAGVTAGDFRVAVPGPGDITTDGEPFASVREESVRRLGGPPPKPDTAGLVLGRYRLVRRLGRGKHVMEAEDIRSGQTVAVYPHPIGPEQHERFLATARVLAGVRHANVIDVHDFGVENDIAYLVTEFVEGATLAESSRLPFTAFVSVVRQIALGLGALHEQGVAHGRLTPQSLLMSPDGTVRITHFEPVQDRGNDESKDLEALGHLLEDLGVEDAPEELRKFEGAFRSRLDGAVRLLLSPDADSQSRALKLLRTTSFGASASETAPPPAFAADRYRYRLLGPVRIERGDDVLPNHSPEEQAVLSMLLLRHGGPVSHVELTEGLWGRHSPGRAGGLSTYSSGLRKILGPGILTTTGGGYALYAPHHSVDVNRCEELAAEAKSLHEDGDPTTARDTVQRALDLWYGEPLDGVPGPAAEATRARLRALRLSLYATRAELDLELGHFERAATDLDDLLRTHPEHEDFHRLRVLARRNLDRVADADRPTITMECADPDDRPEAHNRLAPSLVRLLSLSGLAPDDYDMRSDDNGHFVFTAAELSVRSVLPVLNATLRNLPGILLEANDPPRVRLTFWHTAQPPTPDSLPAPEQSDIAVVLSPVLYDELTDSDLPVDLTLFRPLWSEQADGPPGPVLAWYCPLNLPELAPHPGTKQGGLVRGPFVTRPPRWIPLPEPGRTAVVIQPADGALTLLDPARLVDTPASGPTITYYEVDLTPQQSVHRLSLPSSRGGTFTASVELAWHVEDPVAFVGDDTGNVSERLLAHVVKEAGRVTRRHPVDRVPARGALHNGLHSWPVPGLSVTCSVRLKPNEEPPFLPPATQSFAAPPDAAAPFLVDVPHVLIGFDGPLVRLYTRAKEEQATQELASLLAELRHPDAALSGEPLSPGGAPVSPLEGRSNPLDLLRAFAEHPLGADLRRRLNRIEERAISTATATPFSDSLITTLNALGRRVAVVADNAPSAVWMYLQAHGRLTGLVSGVHGRAEELTRLMPNPDCLVRALDQLGATPSDAVLVGSSVAELTAANAIGLRFLGYTRSEPHKQRLLRAGCELTTASWAPLIQSLPNT